MATKPLCKIDGCGKTSIARGWCNMHYQRWRVGGDMEAPPKTPEGAALAWIDAHKNYSGDDCLIWPFYRNALGYGKVRFEGESHHAHRVMSIFSEGRPKKGQASLHSCGNGHLGCINPNHLRWGSQLENCKDTIAHGRTTRGEKCTTAKLTETDVRNIRRLDGVCTIKEAADMFGVSERNISLIKAGERWGHVE